MNKIGAYEYNSKFDVKVLNLFILNYSEVHYMIHSSS